MSRPGFRPPLIRPPTGPGGICAPPAPLRPRYRRLVHRSVVQRRLLLARMARDRERPGRAAIVFTQRGATAPLFERSHRETGRMRRQGQAGSRRMSRPGRS